MRLLCIAKEKGFWVTPMCEGFAYLGVESVLSEIDANFTSLRPVEACIADFYLLVRNLAAAWRLRRWLRRLNVPLIAIDRDAPWHRGVHSRRLRALQLLGLVDIYATHTMQPNMRFAPLSIYLPNAAWTKRYSASADELLAMRHPTYYRYDVSFVGNLNAARYREHRARAEFVAALGARLAGRGIHFLFRDSADVGPEEELEISKRSRINLNYGTSADDGRERCWGLPERCYGIPARGGFLLSDERKHAADDFAVGSEWISFEDLVDCETKIETHLAHFRGTRDIAEKAHSRVMREHTYELRASRLIDVVRMWRVGGRIGAQ